VLLVPTPTSGYPHIRQRVALSGATYQLRWLWNERDRAWTFCLWDADGGPLVLGVRVVLGVDLLEAAPQGPRRPPYRMVVVDPTQRGQEPGLTDLGSRVKVIYTEPTL
jgi:hypothetical protein